MNWPLVCGFLWSKMLRSYLLALKKIPLFIQVSPRWDRTYTYTHWQFFYVGIVGVCTLCCMGDYWDSHGPLDLKEFMLKRQKGGRRDGLAVKSVGCSTRGPRFNSRIHTEAHNTFSYCSSESDVPFWSLRAPGIVHGAHTQMCAANIQTHMT